MGEEDESMPRKKLLVEDARAGLNALRQHVLNEMQGTPASYRDKFRVLARTRAKTMNQQAAESASQPSTPRPNH